MRGTREEGGFHLKGDDQMVNDAELADLMKFREMCASGDCKAMPSKQKMQIKVKITVIYILKGVCLPFDEIMFLQVI